MNLSMMKKMSGILNKGMSVFLRFRELASFFTDFRKMVTEILEKTFEITNGLKGVCYCFFTKKLPIIEFLYSLYFIRTYNNWLK